MLQEKLAAIQDNRRKSKNLPLGVAPFVSSSDFKLRSTADKPKAKSWDDSISTECQGWVHSNLKAASRLVDQQSTISLGTGRPHPQYYPWTSLGFSATGPRPDNDAKPISMSSYRGDSTYDLDIALNYGFAGGSAQLLRFFTEHVETIHSPPYADWSCCLTCSTTSALEIVLRMLCNRGDWVLTEEYTYPGTLSIAKSLGLRILGVRMDDQGLLPSDLDLKLKFWSVNDGKKPKVLYMIPTGQNPTGTTQSEERRRAIYDVAERHDLNIVEDDPYFYLNLNAGELDAPSIDEYIRRLPVSYVKLDRSGRVLRLDTTSKILSPGLRCGWLTGCAQIIAKFIDYTDLSTLAPNGPSQVMLSKLLDEAWGHQGFLEWLWSLSTQYRQRLDLTLQACRSALPSEVCSFRAPTHGMFMWVRIDGSKLLPRCETLKSRRDDLTAVEVEDQIYFQAKDKGVLISKGSWFAVNSGRAKDIWIRLTFSAAPIQQLSAAVELFGSALEEVFDLPSIQLCDTVCNCCR